MIYPMAVTWNMYVCPSFFPRIKGHMMWILSAHWMQVQKYIDAVMVVVPSNLYLR